MGCPGGRRGPRGRFRKRPRRTEHRQPRRGGRHAGSDHLGRRRRLHPAARTPARAGSGHQRGEFRVGQSGHDRHAVPPVGRIGGRARPLPRTRCDRRDHPGAGERVERLHPPGITRSRRSDRIRRRGGGRATRGACLLLPRNGIGHPIRYPGVSGRGGLLRLGTRARSVGCPRLRGEHLPPLQIRCYFYPGRRIRHLPGWRSSVHGCHQAGRVRRLDGLPDRT